MGILDRFKSKKEQEIAGAPAESKAEAKADAPKADAKKAAKKPAKTAKALPSNLVNVIVAPLVTEKAARLSSAGQYVFEVGKDATRVDVRSAIKAMYGVTPTSVNIQRVRGKVVRFGGRTGQRQTWKKAIVTLPAGKTIDVYEGV